VEYCTAAWSPYYVKDKELIIEKIQHRFSKMIIQVKHLSSTDRLLKLGLWTLEERRNRAALTEVYKIHGFATLSHNRFFKLATNKKTQGNSLSLVKHRFATVIRQHFFSERVVNRWNSLDNEHE